MVQIKLFIVISSVLLVSCSSLNILALFPHPGKSHFRVFEPLLRALAEKGHHITVISPFPQEKPLPRYKDISIKDESDIIFNKFDMKNFDGLNSGLWSPIKIAKIADSLCKTLRSKPIQDFMKSEEKFDLILTEIFNNECYFGFIHKYKIPYVGMCPNVILPWSNTMFGNPANPSYIPMAFHSFSDRMNFYERVVNTLSYLYSELMYKYYIVNPAYEVAKIHFGEDLSSIQDISKNISLLLVNSHFSLNLPRPFMANIIEVGGMFIENKQAEIPQDVLKFLSEAKHGVIYFSMGSMIKGHSFPEGKRRAFINVFKKLKQRVLWKWETDSMPDKPSNVMIQKWMPQKDILCHPNVIAFITHGGLLSTMETVHCGKPVIVLPQYGDQMLNAKALELNQVGIVLNLPDVTEEILVETLDKVLDSKKNAEQLSKKFRDRPVSAMDTAVYWIEYVAKHNGAPHLRSFAVNLPLYQYYLLDVILFLSSIVFITLAIFYYICKLLLCRRKVEINAKSKKVKTN